MSCNSTTNTDSHTPSEILCKFLIKAELPKSSLLDELQDTYFSSLVDKENIFSPANDQEQLSQQSDEWKLFGSFLMEQVSSELKEEEEAAQKDLEAQRIKEWEDKFDEEQKIRLRQELIREEKIEQRERLRRAIKEQEDKTLQDELFTRLDAFEVNETKKN